MHRSLILIWVTHPARLTETCPFEESSLHSQKFFTYHLFNSRLPLLHRRHLNPFSRVTSCHHVQSDCHLPGLPGDSWGGLWQASSLKRSLYRLKWCKQLALHTRSWSRPEMLRWHWCIGIDNAGKMVGHGRQKFLSVSIEHMRKAKRTNTNIWSREGHTLWICLLT